MLNIFGLTFHLYGLLIGFGIVAAVEISTWLAKKRKINPEIIWDLIWWVVIPGVIGARIYHVIDLWSRYYSVQPIKVLFIWQGGLAIYGAVIGGVLGLLARWKIKYQRIKFFDLLDITFVGLPLAQAIGRWGNFFNHELVGKNGEPLFIYESIANLILAGILIGMVRRRRDKPGRITGIYLIGYGLIRFALEPLRQNTIIWRLAGVPVAQIFSVIYLLVGAAFIWRSRGR